MHWVVESTNKYKGLSNVYKDRAFGCALCATQSFSTATSRFTPSGCDEPFHPLMARRRSSNSNSSSEIAVV
jgi:hypothetical protein